MADNDCEILLEDGGLILQEDGLFGLLLETCVPSTAFADAPYSIIRRHDPDRDDYSELDEEEEAVLVLVTLGAL